MTSNTAEGQMSRTYDETRIAEQIVSVLPAGVARELSTEKETIRYAVRDARMKLRTIVMSRLSLRRLIEDPARDVKIEYLQRELVQTAASRCEFRYPRPHVMPKISVRQLQATLAAASTL
jgi:hypothetical protein